jgi:hypothetical protein
MAGLQSGVPDATARRRHWFSQRRTTSFGGAFWSERAFAEGQFRGVMLPERVTNKG